MELHTIEFITKTALLATLIAASFALGWIERGETLMRMRQNEKKE